jgi:hypothetical protein
MGFFDKIFRSNERIFSPREYILFSKKNLKDIVELILHTRKKVKKDLLEKLSAEDGYKQIINSSICPIRIKFCGIVIVDTFKDLGYNHEIPKKYYIDILDNSELTCLIWEIPETFSISSIKEISKSHADSLSSSNIWE